MHERLDVKRIGIFLAFAFSIAWATGLAVYLTGGLVDSPVLLPGTPVTLALLLLTTGYMSAPALAHVLTRLITREGWQNTYLRPRLKTGWPYWLAAWFLPAILTILGAALFFAIFPRYFDPSMSAAMDLLNQTARTGGEPLPFGPGLLVAVQTLQAILLAPLINSLFTFGEEFGWRAYLQPKLMPLGGRKAMLLVGLIWGVWHWPVIAMGHNYGLDYPGAPWLGMLAMVWFTLVLGVFIGWTVLRGGSVWPAVIGHAAINGIASLPAMFIRGTPNLLLGPLPVGLIGASGFTLLMLWIMLRPGALAVPQQAPAAEPGDAAGSIEKGAPSPGS